MGGWPWVRRQCGLPLSSVALLSTAAAARPAIRMVPFPLVLPAPTPPLPHRLCVPTGGTGDGRAAVQPCGRRGRQPAGAQAPAVPHGRHPGAPLASHRLLHWVRLCIAQAASCSRLLQLPPCCHSGWPPLARSTCFPLLAPIFIPRSLTPPRCAAPPLQMFTKLRPGVREFLAHAARHFQLWIHTNGAPAAAQQPGGAAAAGGRSNARPSQPPAATAAAGGSTRSIRRALAHALLLLRLQVTARMRTRCAACWTRRELTLATASSRRHVAVPLGCCWACSCYRRPCCRCWACRTPAVGPASLLSCRRPCRCWPCLHCRAAAAAGSAGRRPAGANGARPGQAPDAGACASLLVPAAGFPGVGQHAGCLWEQAPITGSRPGAANNERPGVCCPALLCCSAPPTPPTTAASLAHANLMPPCAAGPGGAGGHHCNCGRLALGVGAALAQPGALLA